VRIGIVGGGPAGLYLAYLLRRLDSGLAVQVLEQNPPGSTYGFGVVFSDAAISYLAESDRDAFEAICEALETWDDLHIAREDHTVVIDGNGYSAIGRLELLRILQVLCASVGVKTAFGARVGDLAALNDCDLLVGADGVHSMVREALADHLRPRVEVLGNRFVWYGTTKLFPTLTLTFRTNEDGAFVAHHYRYGPTMSTFIVECDAATFTRLGSTVRSAGEARGYCERLFAHDLDGHGLVENASRWRAFPLLSCERWHTDRVVLIGDAQRTVHFSIGSGTRLALEDAIALTGAFAAEGGRLPATLERFEAERRPVVDKLVAAAASSARWYETFAERMHLDAWELAYDYMTRSGRVGDDRLRATAPGFMAGLANRRGRAAGAGCLRETR
jgi:2-polyprenyl-6-methoxyphenol hydroxylase-like FAD-dependent oxidoreductase